MKHIVFILLSLNVSVCLAQKKKKLPKHEKEALQYTFKGNEDLLAGNLLTGEKDYRRAIAKDPSLMEPNYNLAYSSYKANSFQESAEQFKQAIELAENKAEKHAAYHNLGNAYMEMGDAEKAVEAYKNALRNNPTDDETRHNLALAKKAKEQQQQQNKDQKKDQKNKDEKEGDDKKDENKKEENSEEKENKDSDNKENDKKENPEDKEGEDDKPEDEEDKKGDKKDNKDGDGDEKEKEDQKPKPAKGQLSPEQVKSLLEAMENQEKKVQDKMNAQKVKGPKIKSEKDW